MEEENATERGERENLATPKEVGGGEGKETVLLSAAVITTLGERGVIKLRAGHLHTCMYGNIRRVECFNLCSEWRAS